MRKSSLAALAALWLISSGIAQFWAKETFVATIIEGGLESAAHLVGLDRPALMSMIAPWLTAALLLAVPLFIAYKLGEWEREQKSPLEIRFRWNDPAHVEPVPSLWTESSTVNSSHYYIEIVNLSSARTIHDVIVEWNQTPFTRFIDAELGRRATLLARSIDPKETVRVHLFGLNDSLVSGDDDVLHKTSNFTVRARGKDAAEVTANFEYSPLRFPKLLRIR